MSKELDTSGVKTCPCCGSNAVGCISEYHWCGGNQKMYVVACFICKIHTTTYKTKREAKAVWNRRPGNDCNI